MLTCHVNRTVVVFSLVRGAWATVAIADDRADFDQVYATYNQYILLGNFGADIILVEAAERHALRLELPPV